MGELGTLILQALNQYAVYRGNTTTGSQRIALAKALQSLHSSIEGQPTLTVEVDVDASVIGSKELRGSCRQPRRNVSADYEKREQHSYIVPNSSHLDKAISRQFD